MLAGSTVTLVELRVGFTTGDVSGHAPVALAVYGTSVVLAVLLAALGSWGVLALSGDPRAASTGRWVAALLPMGGGVATVAGMATAATQDFRVQTPTFVAVSVVVLLVLTGTVAVARLAAVRLVSRDEPTR